MQKGILLVEYSGGRNVFNFKLVLTGVTPEATSPVSDLQDDRVIPSRVKLEVWNGTIVLAAPPVSRNSVVDWQLTEDGL